MTRPWETVAKRLVLDGAPWLRVWEETVRLPSGRTLAPFYRYRKSDFCCIFAVADDARVLLQRRYRHGPRAVTLDVPAGFVDEGETPLDAAKRELMEETGHEAAAWRALGQPFTDGNSGGGQAHMFLATGARRVGEPREDDTEEAELVHLTEAELRRALDAGGFATLAAVATVSRGLLAWETTR